MSSQSSVIQYPEEEKGSSEDSCDHYLEINHNQKVTYINPIIKNALDEEGILYGKDDKNSTIEYIADKLLTLS